MSVSDTAVLIMDYQNDIVGFVSEAARDALLQRAPAFLAKARAAGMPIIYVVVRFRPGYPEVDAANPLFAGIAKAGVLVEGTRGAEIHDAVAPKPGDIVVTKRRVGAASTTDLEAVLRGRGVNRLVLFGITTSGVVLSTVRWAADADYRIVVISDLSADREQDVHDLLMGKVFPRQATVTTTEDFWKGA